MINVLEMTEFSVNEFSLDGKIAIVTGAAGLYGQAIVDALCGAGALVWMASRNLEKLKQAAEERVSQGHQAKAVAYDQADTSSIEAMVAQIMEESGRIDVLVNNAATRPMKSHQDPAEAFQESMQTNATGLFALTRLAADQMAGQGRGSIINIGSIQGVVGPDATLYEGLGMDGYIPDYFFHKGGMVNFTRYIAAKYGQQGVRCNCLSPGGVLSERMSAEFVQRYSQRTLLGRPANLADIQGPIAFLASDASAYITGTNLMVDGGYTAK